MFEWRYVKELDYIFTESIETTRIELKKVETQPRVFNPETTELRTVLYYAGHILASFRGSPEIQIYKVNGPLLDKINVGHFFTLCNHTPVNVDFIAIPRLDWQDREFDTIQRAQKQLPRKIIFAGEHRPLADPSSRSLPFLILYDRVKPELTVTKIFRSRGLITCVEYGPYDNGHILIGTSTGDFLAFDTSTLTKLNNVKVSNLPVTRITIEPTQLVLVGVE